MYLTVDDTSEIAISVTAHIDSSYPWSDRRIQWFINGTSDGTDDISAYAASVSHTFYSLMPGSTYSISATMGESEYWYSWDLESESNSNDDELSTFNTLYSDYDWSSSDGSIWTTGSSIDVTWVDVDEPIGTIGHRTGSTSSDSGYVSSGSYIYYITSQYNLTLYNASGNVVSSGSGASWSTRYYTVHNLHEGAYTEESASITAKTVSAGPTLYTVTVKVDNSSNGSASASSTSVEYLASVIITATPKTNCEFSNWMIISGDADIADGTSASTSLTVRSDVTVMAFFKRYYTITVSSNNNTYGAASASASRSLPNEKITLTATPNTGYEFVRWNVLSGDATIQDDSWFWMPKNNVSIQAVFQKKQRPDYFEWDTAKVKGEPFNLAASEWNGLRTNINLVLKYKGQSVYAFQTVNTGETFTADHYNSAVMAIQSVSGYGENLSDVVSRERITASCLNLLVSEVNAIP